MIGERPCAIDLEPVDLKQRISGMSHPDDDHMKAKLDSFKMLSPVDVMTDDPQSPDRDAGKQLSPAIMDSKSSRRKQSKPSRVSNLEDGTAVPSAVGPEQAPEAMEVDTEFTQDSEGQRPAPQGEQIFGSEVTAEENAEFHHSPSKMPTTAAFPTAYHRLGSELANGSSSSPPPTTDTDKSGEEHLDVLSLSPSNQTSHKTSSAAMDLSKVAKMAQNSASAGNSTAPSNVFHMDAYCELCQREFCNKYFLKTHKANIHGITSDDSSTKASGGSRSSKSSSASPQHRQQGHSPAAGAPSLQQMASLPVQMASLPAQMAAFHHQQQQQGPLNMVKKEGLAPPTDLEDFCDICQKHFCNKYYLKKHKADVHNIKPEDQASGKTPIKDGGSVHKGSGLAHHQMVPPSMLMPPITSSMGNVVLINPFAPSMLPPSMLQPGLAFLPPPSSLAAAMGAGAEPGSLNGLMTAPPFYSLASHSPASGSRGSESTSPPFGSTPNESLRSMGILNADAYCFICRKEFFNSYFLKAHHAKKHGGHDFKNEGSGGLPPALGDMATDQIKSEGSLDLSTKKSSVSATSGLSLSSFDSMLAAKMADRITCDICNKDVCNKYFLRAHKLKMHGIDITNESTANRQSPVRGQPSGQGQDENTPVVNRNGTVVAERADDITPDNLIRMGIDPEAFCIICKKEFCSKYFLKTHKLNMHGIRANPTTTVTSASVKQEEAVAPPSFLPSKQMSSSNSNLPPFTSAPTSSVGENFTWRWKEPANQTRVFCDICNKELCNKYFLRTHKINKHGITDENLLRAPSTSGGSAGGLTPNSGTSEKSPLNLSMAGGPTAATGASPMDILSMKFDIEKPSANNGSMSLPLTSRKGPSMGVADLEKAMFEAEAAMRSALHQGSPVKASHLPCDICGLMFVSVKELQMHLAEEHQEEIQGRDVSAGMLSSVSPSDQFSPNVPARRSFTKGLEKLYSCSHCDYKTRWLSNIYSHEQRKHSGGAATPHTPGTLHTCKVCMRSFSYEHSLMRHMAEYHDRGKVKDMPGKAMSESGHTRKVKCHYCSERFPSKVLCQTHIRQQHGIRTSNSGNSLKPFTPVDGQIPGNINSSSAKLYACDKCSFTCRMYRNLKMHQVIKHKARESRDLKTPISHLSQSRYSRSPGPAVGPNDNAIEVPPRAASCPISLHDPVNRPIEGGLGARRNSVGDNISRTVKPEEAEGDFILQPFQVKQLDGRSEFSLNSMTTIYLPVLKEVAEEVSVTLTLKPVDK